MDYKKIYDALVYKAKNRSLNGYYETHHILPRCMNGTNDTNNLVLLTAREHYIAHYLLYKIYKNTEHSYKLICAFRYMTVDSHGGNRATSKDYDWMRKEFSKNHPMKQPEIALKTSISLKKYYENETSEQKEIRLTKMMKTLFSEEVNKKRKESINTYINSLTKDQIEERLNKSARNCDHKKRGESISKAKKGKTTNQQEIMGKRYAKMTDSEFSEFLKTKSERVHKGMIKLRNVYK